MRVSRSAQQWTALTVLATLAVAVLWVVMVQVFLVLVSPTGEWQPPRAARVTISSVYRDPDSQLTDFVNATQGDISRELRMLKAEARELHPGEDVWILDNSYAHGIRPDHFRLTPQRLLLEYPEPLFVLALWGIRRIRKAQARDARKLQERPRTVWKDEFHKRAERFADKGNGKGLERKNPCPEGYSVPGPE